MALLLCPSAVLLLTPAALAATAFETYGQQYRAVPMPPHGAGSSGVTADALPDGRLLAVTGLDLLLETAPRSGVFARVGSFDAAASGGPSDPAFLRVSPDGSRVAVGIGLGKPVAVFAVSALGSAAVPSTLSAANASFFSVPHYDAAWADATHLAITAGSFGAPARVTLLDTVGPVGLPSNPTIVANIGGASAGIAFDTAGRLFTGNGFDLGPGGSSTGWIKAFSPAAWGAGASGGPAADFEASGQLVADVLSAGSLTFDAYGNLAVGGGDFDSFDAGYLGVLNGVAIGATLAGGAPVNTADPGSLRRLNPTGAAFGYFGAAYNGATGELFVTDTDFSAGRTTWYGTAPGPGVGAVVLLGAGAAGGRRRGR